MPIDVAAIRARYEAAGQGQVFAFFDSLPAAEQDKLATQAQALDVDRVNSIYARAMQGEEEAKALASKQAELAPPPKNNTVSFAPGSQEEEHARKVGLDAIREGKVGVLLLAGGQGTRLGSSAPKGCYDIGLASSKSLFQLQAERIRRLEELAGCKPGKGIPWFIMTSGPTRKPTQEYFQSKNFFGLREQDVVFFEQGTLPCLTMDGKIMLESPSTITAAPDGNGGIYAALRSPLSPGSNDSVLSQLASRGVDFLHTYGVDNCLVRVGDPVFIGACIDKGVSTAVKTVVKTDAKESVGVVALRNSKWSVIEYSEIPSSLAESREEATGDLRFRSANIVNHFYSTSFLSQEVPRFEGSIPYHVARKKIPTVDESGSPLKPSSPNGMKLELFIFDVLPYLSSTDDLLVHEVERSREFSPLKNAPGTGTDDPQTSVRDLKTEWKRWLVEATGEEVDDVEISPLVSYAGEGLEGYKGNVKSGQLLEK